MVKRLSNDWLTVVEPTSGKKPSIGFEWQKKLKINPLGTV